MNTFKFSTLLILGILFLSCSSTQTVTTPATDQKLSIDGSLTGWNVEESLVEETDVVNYYATHDEEYLYLYVDVKSPAHNNAMRQSGFIMYLSSSEENRKQVGIAFPAGSFNLLREDPVAYNSFLNDREWLQKPQNTELLEKLEEDIFERIMIVEESSSGKDYGFLNKDQLQIDGIQVAAEKDRRLVGIEMRVPLDASSFYNLKGDNIWMGFEIDPPDFRLQNEQNSSSQQQRYGSQRRPSRQAGNTRSNFRHLMGEYERWYLLDISQ